MTFALHPQLVSDTVVLGDLPLCRVLLMNDAHFPWLILVPMRPRLRELYDLDAPDYLQAMQEIRVAAKTLAACVQAYKINIAALGNQVAQLHIHIIARFAHDAAWPHPVWNSGVAPIVYKEKALSAMVSQISMSLFSSH